MCYGLTDAKIKVTVNIFNTKILKDKVDKKNIQYCLKQLCKGLG